MIPIIIPITNTQTRDCIVQSGTRYCEDSKITRNEGKAIAGIVVGIILWVALWIWISEKIEYAYNIDSLATEILGIFVLPAILLLIFL